MDYKIFKNEMQIGFDAKRAFLNSSGLGNYSRNTLNALHRFFPQNEYILFTPEISNRFFENYKHFKVVSPKNRVAKKMKSLWRSLFLVPQLKRHQVDIFHGLSNELPKGIHKSGIPSLVTIHDLVFMRFPEFYQPIDRKIYFKKVKYACSVADKIIAISRQTKNDIETFLQIDSEKIEIIYQPVDPAFFKKQNTTSIIHKYNIPGKFILAVGTIEPRKNLLALIKAIHRGRINLPLVIVGKPTSYVSQLYRYISENGIENKVKFLSNLPVNDLAGLYQSAALSVYLSICEGFGLPVIESMASGCPVITSNVSCLPETAGGSAILCNPSNIEEISEKISLVLNNKSLSEEIIQEGLKRAKLFNPETYAKNLISIYSNIIKRENE